MMNQDEFRKIIMPLTSKEKLYQSSPKLSEDFYNSPEFTRTPDGVYRFGSLARSENIFHGMIGDHVMHHRHNITLCKQTRFSAVPMHTHDYVEMNYVFSGHGQAIINGKTVHLHTGEICILDSQVVHTILPTYENDVILNVLMAKSYFHNGFITRISDNDIIGKFILGVISEQERHDQYLLFHTDSEKYLHELIIRLFCEYLDACPSCEIAIDCHMQLIFVELTRFWQKSNEHEYHKIQKNYMTEILRYIEEHHTSCSLKEIATHFGFHPNALSRKIRKETGQSFEEILTHYRLRTAAFLLKNSNSPINVVAEQCGYTNQKAFYTKFLRAYQCTPGEYRKADHGNDFLNTL